MVSNILFNGLVNSQNWCVIGHTKFATQYIKFVIFDTPNKPVQLVLFQN